MTDASLQGRVAVVTGGARGIGAAISAALVAQGAKVVIADNGTSIDGSGTDASIATNFAASLGASATAYTDTLESPASAAAAVQLAVKHFGGLDIVVNNAAILRDAFVFKANAADWDWVIRNNLSVPYYMLAAATPIMREQAKAKRGDGKWGRIVNIVSSAGLYGNFGQSAYASAKAGLFGLTRTVALDMARSGVTCNAIAPFAATRVTDTIQPANEAQAQYKERALRIAPSHVATLVAALASDASQAVTGQLFAVRGREVFLLSQPRPIAQISKSHGDWDIADLGAALQKELAHRFTDATTDLEAFNTEPLV
ncbi:MAG TPA: SDR family NAD(P)-dependent oxidoreductase [Steroidobacteraceae bacterium]|nr:SDR family NAD(P)-dependent oxidoreductase [Steroidobacteraceae bacterium]